MHLEKVPSIGGALKTWVQWTHTSRSRCFQSEMIHKYMFGTDSMQMIHDCTSPLILILHVSYTCVAFVSISGFTFYLIKHWEKKLFLPTVQNPPRKTVSIHLGNLGNVVTWSAITSWPPTGDVLLRGGVKGAPDGPPTTVWLMTFDVWPHLFWRVISFVISLR